MNTDVQKTHKIVVGAGVALIAAVGIGTVAMNVHRVVIARSATSAEPAAPLPDTSAQQLSQTPEMAPPPIADGAVPPSAESTAAAPETAPAVSSSQASAPAANAVRQPSAAPAHRSSSTEAKSTPPIAASAPKSTGTNQVAVVSANRKLESDQSAATQAPSSSGIVVGSSMTGTAPAAASVADARDYASAGAPAAASGAPALGSDEVTTTAEARAAGGDSATSDRMINDAVQSQLDADTASQGGALAVNTINGVVILTGTAPNAEVVEHAKQVAQQVRGVKGVDATAVKVSGS